MNYTPADAEIYPADNAPGCRNREWNTPELKAGEEYTFEELRTPKA